MTGEQKNEGGSVLCAVRNMLTSLKDEVDEVLKKEFECPKNRRSRRGSRRSRIPRNSSPPDSRSQSVPPNPEQSASRRRARGARSSSRGSRRSRSVSPHDYCSRAELGCPGSPIKSGASPLWNSSTEVPEFGRRALPIVYWQPAAARGTKSQAVTHHKCKSLRRGCADRRCRSRAEVAPHARSHRRKLRQAQFLSHHVLEIIIVVKPS